jgi:hypothetical protein
MGFFSPGAYLDPILLFHSFRANIICLMVFGECFTYQDHKFLQVLNMLKDSFTILSSFYSLVNSKITQYPRNWGRWIWEGTGDFTQSLCKEE